jgi:predicted nuclease with TOPRIM domain
MTQSVDTDLKDILLEIRSDIKQINNRLNQLEIGQAKIETKLEEFDKRFISLETRLNDNEKRFWTLILGAFIALFGLLVKMSFFPKI